MPTILDLFQSSGLNNSVKSDTETLVEQELTGLRIKICRTTKSYGIW